jgi:branched-chain amino acid transport system permease protein
MDNFVILTVNGLATGMLIFLIASGLSLIFGLMHVLNFAHGTLFLWGAYTSAWLYVISGSFAIGLLGGAIAGIIIGLVAEKYLVSKVYGNIMAQILITVGIMLVLHEVVIMIWGPNVIAVSPPDYLRGSWVIGNITFVKYRIFAIVVGLIVLVAMHLLLNKTKIGMTVRAGVQNTEMIQALGVNIRRLFTMVFMLGAGLAAFGGAMVGPYNGVISPLIGLEYQLTAFIVVVIGGLGSVLGSALGSVLVGLAGAYVAWFWPEGSMAVNVILMALILLLKPSGLMGLKG